MKFLFDKQKILSVYGASIIALIVVLIALIIGLAMTPEEQIENPSEQSAQYAYYEKLQKSEAALKSGFFPNRCAPCHIDIGSGPASLEETTVEMMEIVVENTKCSGYRFDENRCAMCHHENDPMLLFEWEFIESGVVEHPDIESFYEGVITELELDELKTAITFEKRLMPTQWFAIIISLLGFLAVVLFVVLKSYQNKTRSAKKRKYLTR